MKILKKKFEAPLRSLGIFVKILNGILKEVLWRMLRTLEDPWKTFTMFYLQIGIIENMTELRPAVCQVAGEQGMLGWLLRRLKVTVTWIDWQGFSICVFWVIASEDKIEGSSKSLKCALRCCLHHWSNWTCIYHVMHYGSSKWT